MHHVEVKHKRQDGPVDELPERKRVRKLLLAEELDKMLQVNKTKEGAGGVTTRVVVETAEGLCLAYNRNLIWINRP